MKFMIHSKRICLMPCDVDNALILNNVEVRYTIYNKVLTSKSVTLTSVMS